MTAFVRRLRPIAFVVLLGCPMPSSSASVDASLGDGALVIAGTAEEKQSWAVTVRIDDAPAGQYLLFTSFEPPTSAAGLATFDKERCAPDCDVPASGSTSTATSSTPPARSA